MIRVRDVRKIYETLHGNKLVLDGIGFDLAMGERLGVLGRNGAGKSTMIRLISGAEYPTSGTIEREMSVSWPLAFGGAFQVMLTGIDNVRFISRIYNQDFKENIAFVEDFAELGAYLNEPVRTYSSGMRARLAFALSMIIEFDCFLIDEVGAVGDARFHERCDYELFEKRADRSMIIVSHSINYIRDHCSRWGVLHDGRLSLHSDFDIAYGEYAETIGLKATTNFPSIAFDKRAAMLEAASRIALADDQFNLHIDRGNWGRDTRDWQAAEQGYAAALSLHPYQNDYWIQHGHVVREQHKFTLAEISYRNACALGHPVDNVRPFLSTVFAENGITEEQYPIRALTHQSAALQPPSSPDIKILSRLLWSVDEVEPVETLDLMRRHATLDELASEMIADVRYRSRGDHANRMGGDRDETEMWLSRLCFLASPGFDYTDATQRSERIGTGMDVLDRLVSMKGFSDWPKTQIALRDASVGKQNQCVV